MNFLEGQFDGSDPGEGYRLLGYKQNPFPKQGQVDGKVYVSRGELNVVENDLKAFLAGREHGTVWAVQGAIGYGKSNFLKSVELGIQEALRANRLTRTACRFIPSLSLTPQRVVQEILMGIGEEMLVKLVEHRPLPPVPEQLKATDFGRFWVNVNATSPTIAADFLLRWLGGQQTYKTEREKYNVTAREKLPPAVGFPYLRALLGMLDEADLMKRIVLLLDEFEDIERLPRASLTEYIQVLKTLLNAFNWEGLYVIIAGQAAAFTSIGEKYPSIASRWRSVSLLPVQTTDDAVGLATAYKKDAALKESKRLDALPPTELDIKATFIRLYEKNRVVTQRLLLTALHESLEQAAQDRRSASS